MITVIMTETTTPPHPPQGLTGGLGHISQRWHCPFLQSFHPLSHPTQVGNSGLGSILRYDRNRASGDWSRIFKSQRKKAIAEELLPSLIKHSICVKQQLHSLGERPERHPMTSQPDRNFCPQNRTSAVGRPLFTNIKALVGLFVTENLIRYKEKKLGCWNQTDLDSNPVSGSHSAALSKLHNLTEP